jgi:hypothetical protein
MALLFSCPSPIELLHHRTPLRDQSGEPNQEHPVSVSCVSGNPFRTQCNVADHPSSDRTTLAFTRADPWGPDIAVGFIYICRDGRCNAKCHAN